MASLYTERAISEAIENGKALLKFISPNDAGTTGSHQAGFLLPKGPWKLFTPNPPEKGVNSKHDVKITWQDGLVTESVVTWYGQLTRSEYRLTRFGRDFPWLTNDSVGNLLVLIPHNLDQFSAYVFDLDEDIEEILAALGAQPFEHWAVYDKEAPIVEDENECMRRKFEEFSKKLEAFPAGIEFSTATQKILNGCIKEFSKLSIDDGLLKSYETEYELFKRVERQLCQSEIVRLFKDVDDFLKTAATIMNRRKSRAGRSLENHVDYFLKAAGVPHEVRPEIDGKPDIIIPSRAAYYDKGYPLEKLFVVGVKTTCKDRWRQVLNEGTRVKRKHILTLQPGISGAQLDDMHKAGVTLIVPERLQKTYPTSHAIQIMKFSEFAGEINTLLKK